MRRLVGLPAYPLLTVSLGRLAIMEGGDDRDTELRRPTIVTDNETPRSKALERWMRLWEKVSDDLAASLLDDDEVLVYSHLSNPNWR